jgi:hypothetical protein
MLPRVLARRRQLHDKLLLALAPDGCRRSLLEYGREAQPAGRANEHGGELAIAHRRPDEQTSVGVFVPGSRLHEQDTTAEPPTTSAGGG